MKPNSTNKPSTKPIPKAPVTKAPVKATPRPSFLDSFMEKNGLWTTIGLVLLLIMIIFHKFIFGNSFYLFKDIGSDTLNGVFPNWVCASNYFRTDGFPTWSFSQGMGQNILWPTFMDVFYSIVYFVDPHNIAGAIIWMEIAKLLVTAALMYHFFKLWKISNFAASTGTLLYCFSGFMIVGGSWIQFSTEATYLAFLLFSFEKLYRQDSWYLFPIAVALIPIFQPFNLFFYGLFLILYYLFRFFSSEENTLKQFWVLTGKMAALSLLGVFMSGFLTLSPLQLILDSPRVGGNSTYFNKLLSFPVFGFEGASYYTTAALRLFSNDILGNGSSFRGWYNYLEAPLFYIGLLPLLLAPQVFIHLTNRKRIVYSIFFLIFFIPVVFPYFRYAFWLFTGDYFRGFSLFCSLPLLFFSLSALDGIEKSRKINLVLLIVTAVVLLGVLYFPYPFADQIIQEGIRSTIRNFLVIYTVILVLFNITGLQSVSKYLLLFFLLIEIGYLNLRTEDERTTMTSIEMKQKTGYNDFTVDAVSYIHGNDKGFFRVNKDFTSNPAIHSSLNNAKVQDYYGTSSYHSFNQKYYIRFMEEMGILKKGIEAQSRWAAGLLHEPLLLNLASNKYHLATNPNSVSLYRNFGYDSVGAFGNIAVLKNKFFIPLGFTYSQYIPISDFLKLPRSRKDQILQRAFVAEEPLDPSLKDLRAITAADTVPVYTYNLYFDDIAALKRDTFAIGQFSQKHITGKISVDSTKFLFFSIPYDKGWNAKINGKKVEPVLSNLGFMGFLLKPGQYEVDLQYTPLYFNASIVVSVIAIMGYLILLVVTTLAKKKKIVSP
ncbi:MAG: YfhO family protein [Bacteroidetes bacterium]|nr:YfhO family protein [Bacteroidota bacterium]